MLVMDGVQNMNLSESDGGMTPFKMDGPSPTVKQPAGPTSQNFVYQPNIPPSSPPQNIPEKNNSISKEMDSTPISDIMPGEDILGPVGGGPDPRFMMAQQPMFVQQQLPVPNGYQQQPKQVVASKNPMNLTDEQMEALLAGVVALVAFSGFAQEKLSTLVPKFLDEAGKRSTVGMIVTALLAAIIFYFGRRFVIRD
jgi:hypothetical protein